MIKPLCFIAAAICLTTLSSCSLLGSILKIPTSVLSTVGRTVGVSGLTDEAPDPIKDQMTDDTSGADEKISTEPTESSP